MSASRLTHGDFNDQVALENIMGSLNRIAVLRSRRMVSIEKRMSPYILAIMLIMSVTMVASFFGKATGEISIDYIYVFLLPMFYTSLFMTLVDLSSPFDGYWAIKLEAVSSVRDKIARQVDSEDAGVISLAAS